MKKALVRQVLSLAQCCGKGDSGILIIAIKKKDTNRTLHSPSKQASHDNGSKSNVDGPNMAL